MRVLDFWRKSIRSTFDSESTTKNTTPKDASSPPNSINFISFVLTFRTAARNSFVWIIDKSSTLTFIDTWKVSKRKNQRFGSKKKRTKRKFEKQNLLFSRCGDLNVAHEPIDLSNSKKNSKIAGHTKEEREDFSKILSDGFFDGCSSFDLKNRERKAAQRFSLLFLRSNSLSRGNRLLHILVVLSQRSITKYRLASRLFCSFWSTERKSLWRRSSNWSSRFRSLSDRFTFGHLNFSESFSFDKQMTNGIH